METKVRLRIMTLIWALLLGTFLPAHAQVGVAKWGEWKPFGPRFPLVEARVRCNFTIVDEGVRFSDWSYQFRHHYDRRMAIVESEEFYDLVRKVNKPNGAEGIIELDPGQESFAFPGTIQGGCHQEFNIGLSCAVDANETEKCWAKTKGAPPSNLRVFDSSTGQRLPGIDALQNNEPDKAKRGSTADASRDTSNSPVNPLPKYDPFSALPPLLSRSCTMWPRSPNRPSDSEKMILNTTGTLVQDQVGNWQARVSLHTLPNQRLQFLGQTVDYTLSGPQKNDSGASGDDADTSIWFRTWDINLGGFLVHFEEALWVDPNTNRASERQSILGSVDGAPDVNISMGCDGLDNP